MLVAPSPASDPVVHQAQVSCFQRRSGCLLSVDCMWRSHSLLLGALIHSLAVSYSRRALSFSSHTRSDRDLSFSSYRCANASATSTFSG